MTFQETLAVLRGKMATAKVDGQVVYQFCLSGDNGGDFYVSAADGKAELHEGLAESPNLTVSMADTDFEQMIGGKLNATTAFMAGKIKIKGDMMLAMKLQSLLG